MKIFLQKTLVYKTFTEKIYRKNKNIFIQEPFINNTMSVKTFTEKISI